MHADPAHKLLAQKVADLDEGAALRDGAVDGEMGVDGAHLVLVALQNVKAEALRKVSFISLFEERIVKRESELK